MAQDSVELVDVVEILSHPNPRAATLGYDISAGSLINIEFVLIKEYTGSSRASVAHGVHSNLRNLVDTFDLVINNCETLFLNPTVDLGDLRAKLVQDQYPLILTKSCDTMNFQLLELMLTSGIISIIFGKDAYITLDGLEVEPSLVLGEYNRCFN